MAVSNFHIFQKWAYGTAMEMLTQDLEKFNAASKGTIVLKAGANVGDFTEAAKYAEMVNMVKRRDHLVDTTIPEQSMAHVLDNSVKLHRRTDPWRADVHFWQHIQQDPKLAGAMYGRALGQQRAGEMLNTAISAVVAAISANTAIEGVDATTDITGATVKHFRPAATNTMKRPFGGQVSKIKALLMHSMSDFDYHGDGLDNGQNLFSYDDVNVTKDSRGVPFIVTDSSAFVINGTPDKYLVAGLTAGAVTVEDNGDFYMNESELNGKENITKTLQSQWSYNLSVKNQKFDKATGGINPNAAALVSSGNWVPTVNHISNTAGVLLKTLEKPA